MFSIKPFINLGTTTLEAKSGYGLTFKDEIRSLKIIKELWRSEISKEMGSLESSDWMVLAEFYLLKVTDDLQI